jgi:hypothetical protein
MRPSRPRDTAAHGFVNAQRHRRDWCHTLRGDDGKQVAQRVTQIRRPGPIESALALLASTS